ncbi:putative secreted protein [Streptomyces davaonensis JCM 4913]|uniref:Putative secreted protein n=1 Tax=Streptomyces davaonensis (strain DSM 101723 / JCM 4913 / KCC S-0913 / 768) TaxID=1214101 RepID=K4QTT3_STRDJ|nr:hypothetical protein [Streptomyces davaonensis]CCK26951.1 putative secreted protein [Streptomyces davaonensis JCM 4913]
MTSKQVMTVIILAAVLTWSTVMTVLGQLAALVALLPSLGLLIQQTVSALSGLDTRATTAAPAPAAGPEQSEETPR